MNGMLGAMSLFLSGVNLVIGRSKRFVASRFLQILRRDDLVALYHQLHPAPLYLSQAQWNSFSARGISGTASGEMIALADELVSRRLFISDHSVDLEELDLARAKALRLLDRPTILYLMLAQHCNYACKNCPIPALAKKHGDRRLSFEDAVAGIKLWQRHIADAAKDCEPYYIIFYGGEPLLNRDVLEALLPYIHRERNAGNLPRNIELMLCTNGSLIDDRISALLASYDVTVAVGSDGPGDFHDRIRITAEGDPTSGVAVYSIKKLIRAGVRVVASATITPANAEHLSEYPVFFRELGVSQFGFNLLKGGSLKSELAGKGIEEHGRLVARGIASAYDDFAKTGRCYEYQLEKKMSVFTGGNPFSLDCTCYGSQLVIQADGQVSNCPFLRIDQGHVRKVSDGFRIGRTKDVEKWRTRISLLVDSSFESGVLDGGGCAWSCSELYGDALHGDVLNSVFTKEVAREIIWRLLPDKQRDAIQKGASPYWGYRGVGPVPAAGSCRKGCN